MAKDKKPAAKAPDLFDEPGKATVPEGEAHDEDKGLSLSAEEFVAAEEAIDRALEKERGGD